jgi:hypothetical protein
LFRLAPPNIPFQNIWHRKPKQSFTRFPAFMFSGDNMPKSKFPSRTLTETEVKIMIQILDACGPSAALGVIEVYVTVVTGAKTHRKAFCQLAEDVSETMRTLKKRGKS